MKTVKKMIEELKKFPEDAVCYAYEGEANGLTIISKDSNKHGFIFCSFINKDEDEVFSEYFSELTTEGN